jgi:hypothetical protein
MKGFFVQEGSIVRKIWGQSDTVLLIFAGASAEFALNKSVDWLYFTGRLPADPIGRLFSTVRYAQQIVFAETAVALGAIDRITSIHQEVEAKRGARIPDTAYLDVLFMLIDYSIRSFELLQRKLKDEEKSEVFEVFHRLGSRMGLKGLPDNYPAWKRMRSEYLEKNLASSPFTTDLYDRYKNSLGSSRYLILLHVQVLLAPPRVRKLLPLPPRSILYPALPIYKLARFIHVDWLIKALLLPAKHSAQIAGLDGPNAMEPHK